MAEDLIPPDPSTPDPKPAPPKPPGTGTFVVHYEGDAPPQVVVAPAPVPLTPVGRVLKYTPFAVAFLFFAVSVYQYSTGGTQVVPVPPVFPQRSADDLNLASNDPDAPIQTFGWVADPLAVQAVVGQEQIPAFGDTPAGQAAQGDGDAFLWEAVRKCLEPGAPYPNVNQRDVGCCVGCGYKHSVDVLQAVQIAQGKPGEFKAACVSAIYGGSRVEIGGKRISGDGSVGAWAAKWLKDYGVLPMQNYPGVADLSVFSPRLAREWGAKGVPPELERLSRDHPVKGVAQVRTADECKKAILQGYPVPVCSNQGFSMQRDAAGFCRPSGNWGHCMAIIGYRADPKRPGFFILNSWGDSAHTGPRYPADAPAAGFWADASVVEGMLAYGDSFALSDVNGFPARKLNWDFVRVRPAAEPLVTKPAAVFAAELSH